MGTNQQSAAISQARTGEPEGVYAKLFDASGDALFVHGLTGGFRYVNRTACDRLGYSREELLKMGPPDIEPPGNSDIIEERKRALCTEGELVFESVHVTRNGESFPVEISSRMLQHNGESLILSVARDIRERKKAEKRFHRLNSFLNAIRSINALAVGEHGREDLLQKSCCRLVETRGCIRVLIHTVDEAGNVTKAYGAGINSISPDDADLSETDLPLCAEEALNDPGTMVIMAAHENCAGCSLESEICTFHGVSSALKSGERVFGVLTALVDPERENPSEELGLIQEISADIGMALGKIEAERHRERAQRKLQQSKTKYKTIFNEARDGIALADPETRVIVNCNDALARIVRRSKSELIGQHASCLHPSEERFREDFERHLNAPDGQVIASRLVTADGEEREVEVKGNKLRFNGKTLLQGIFRDVTERNRTKRAIKESEKRFRVALMQAPFPIMLHAADGEVVIVNNAWSEISGYASEEIQTITDWVERAYPDNPGKTREEILRMHEREGSYDEGEFSVRAKDGSERIWHFHSTQLPPLPDGRSLVLSIAADVTERKRDKKRLEELNEELERSNKDLQEFTYTASHDLQEPLRKVHTFGQFLEEDCGDQLPEESREHLRRMQNAAVRMKSLIQHLLKLSRVGTHGKELHRVDAGRVVREAIEVLQDQISGVGGSIETTDTFPEVMADEIQLDQLFRNLLGNAVKYRSSDRPLRIRVDASVEGEMVRFRVEDNGIGIREEYREKIFGVFKRLHRRDEYEGTGIGLALCEKIVRRHDGEIWVESVPGEGSTFFFTLRKAPDTGHKG